MHKTFWASMPCSSGSQGSTPTPRAHHALAVLGVKDTQTCQRSVPKPTCEKPSTPSKGPSSCSARCSSAHDSSHPSVWLRYWRSSTKAGATSQPSAAPSVHGPVPSPGVLPPTGGARETEVAAGSCCCACCCSCARCWAAAALACRARCMTISCGESSHARLRADSGGTGAIPGGHWLSLGSATASAWTVGAAPAAAASPLLLPLPPSSRASPLLPPASPGLPSGPRVVGDPLRKKGSVWGPSTKTKSARSRNFLRKAWVRPCGRWAGQSRVMCVRVRMCVRSCAVMGPPACPHAAAMHASVGFSTGPGNGHRQYAICR